MCHSDPDATGERNGEEFSVFIDPDAFADSVHKDFGCIDCHTDLDGAELPHAEELEPVSCGMCHDEAEEDLKAGPHSKWAKVKGSPSAACVRCHTSHQVLPISEFRKSFFENQGKGLCAQCHKRESRQIEESPHGKEREDGMPGAFCEDCHKGHQVKPPRTEEQELEICGKCHVKEARQQGASLHAMAALEGDSLAPRCITCHGSHAIKSKSDPESPTATTNIPLLCGRCHREGTKVSKERNITENHILQNFSMSVHGRGLFEKGLTVTAVCTSCHTAHFILDRNDPKSSINRKNVAKTCMQCHARIEEVHTKVIEGRLWEEAPHKVPSCVECHRPHKIRQRPVESRGASNKHCFECHKNRDLTMERDGKIISAYVDEESYALSSHAGVACAQCHTQVDPGQKERPCITVTEKVDCSICHAEVVADYDASTHGKLAAQGDTDIPTCLTCHDQHYTQSHKLPSSPTFSRNIPDLCGQCHAAGKVAAVRLKSKIPDIVASYKHSAHGKGLLESGLVVSASCVDCHSTHKTLPADDPGSSVSRKNLADTCGQCHKGIEEEFKKSIHWPSNTKTTKMLPVCEDCHSSHKITRVDAQGFRFKMMNQCGHCHEDYAETFFETYHGKVTQLGSEGAAKCYDCHGTHNILPSTDPRSTLSQKNIVETCGQCHPRAHLKFAGYLTHATHHDPKRYPYLYYSFLFMTTLLVGTLAFFLLHTLLWLFRLSRSRKEWAPLKAKAPQATKFYRRFTTKQRLMHFIMLLSFFTLALTGMSLKFSYMTWAHAMTKILGGYDTMGILHRVAAVILILLFLSHIRDIFRYKASSGKGWFRFIFGPNSIMFNLQDLVQFRQSVTWFLGKGERPKYGRFTYWEKFDYFAVFWGVFVIGSTGLILWFPVFFTRFLPGWSVNVATIIHSDEALLAVAFIFTIHFFNTHFRPDKFPMDPVIFTGRVPLDELQHDKPAEYEEFVQRAEEEGHEDRVVGPKDPRFERIAKIFGFTALFIGLSLIGLIVYAMLFNYM